MGALTFRQFQKALTPVLSAIRTDKKDLGAFVRGLKDRPRTLTAAEMLLVLAYEASIVYSRREKKYV